MSNAEDLHPSSGSGARNGALLEGHTALITGGAAGVGLGIAGAMAAAGAAVVIASRRADVGEESAAAIRARGDRAQFVQCDVTDPAQVDAAVATAVERFGGLDVMVHNAVSGAGPPRPLQAVRNEVIAAQIDISTTAAFLCARAAFPHLRKRPGSMILLTSPAGIEGSANLPVYATVKAAQRGLLKSLAREWGPLGIRVNAIAPLARTPAMDAATAANPVLEVRLVARTPLGRIGDPETDVGPAAVFLASEMSAYITGQTLVTDGGGFLGL